MTDLEKMEALFESFGLKYTVKRSETLNYIDIRTGFDGDYEITYYFNEDGSYKELICFYNGF